MSGDAHAVEDTATLIKAKNTQLQELNKKILEVSLGVAEGAIGYRRSFSFVPASPL